MSNEIVCPQCVKHNRNTKLELKQISFERAVYICPRKKCKYPKGHPWLLVKRPFCEMMRIRKEEVLKQEDALFTRIVSQESTSQSNEFNSILNDLENLAKDFELGENNIQDNCKLKDDALEEMLKNTVMDETNVEDKTLLNTDYYDSLLSILG